MNQSSMLKKIAAEKLKVIEPEIFEECEQMLIAPLKDLSLLPSVFNEMFHRLEPNPENSAFILAIAYFLYAPYKLHYQNIRCPNGMREIVCQCFGWADAPTVSYYGGILVSYYKNPRWAARVKENAEEVLQIINENKAEILAAYKDGRDGE